MKKNIVLGLVIGGLVSEQLISSQAAHSSKTQPILQNDLYHTMVQKIKEEVLIPVLKEELLVVSEKESKVLSDIKTQQGIVLELCKDQQSHCDIGLITPVGRFVVSVLWNYPADCHFIIDQQEMRISTAYAKILERLNLKKICGSRSVPGKNELKYSQYAIESFKGQQLPPVILKPLGNEEKKEKEN